MPDSTVSYLSPSWLTNLSREQFRFILSSSVCWASNRSIFKFLSSFLSSFIPLRLALPNYCHCKTHITNCSGFQKTASYNNHYQTKHINTVFCISPGSCLLFNEVFQVMKQSFTSVLNGAAGGFYLVLLCLSHITGRKFTSFQFLVFLVLFKNRKQ